MVDRLTLAFCISLVAFGCGRKTESAGSPNHALGATGENAGATHEDRPTASVSASGNRESEMRPDQAATLGALTQAVRKYSAEKQRVPGNLNELVAAGYLKSIPAAPPGKSFVINPKRVEVILVTQ